LFKNGVLNVEFIYQSKYQNTKKLRDFVEVICDVLKLSNTLTSRIILISDELNNNAIEYGTGA
jgi:anti-sigma regulatory factor (Ser/Thr protein kinase)